VDRAAVGRSRPVARARSGGEMVTRMVTPPRHLAPVRTGSAGSADGLCAITIRMCILGALRANLPPGAAAGARRERLPTGRQCRCRAAGAAHWGAALPTQRLDRPSQRRAVQIGPFAGRCSGPKRRSPRPSIHGLGSEQRRWTRRDCPGR
jgi:hypothetical protein